MGSDNGSKCPSPLDLTIERAGDPTRLAASPRRGAANGKRQQCEISFADEPRLVLLHFVMTTQGFTAGGGRSACDRVVHEITKNHFPGYVKGTKDIFETLAARLDSALTHASRLSDHNRGTGSKNPATAVHKLVAYLQWGALKRNGRRVGLFAIRVNAGRRLNQGPMIRIAITVEAFEAIVATLPFGTVAYELEPNANGERMITAMRGAGESYSDVILRLVEIEARRR